MVLAAQTVRVVPKTAYSPFSQFSEEGASHHPPAAVTMTKALSLGFVRAKRSLNLVFFFVTDNDLLKMKYRETILSYCEFVILLSIYHEISIRTYYGQAG